MERRRYIPLFLLGVLAVGTAVFAVIGLRSGPPSGNIEAENATAATFGSPIGTTSFNMDLISTVSSGSGSGVLSQERAVAFRRPAYMVVFQVKPQLKILGTEPKAAVPGDIEKYALITGGSGAWVAHGTTLTRTESLQTFSTRVPPKKPEHGTVYETLEVRDGYLVNVYLRVVVPRQSLGDDQFAPNSVVGETFKLLTINGKKVSALRSAS
jgi:hypothetical protein